ncbi:MAG: hypothetical protein HY328_08285 [Chloroflexi bacterium]|nr:hypothetical protein [Chloroflexota bacterium]
MRHAAGVIYQLGVAALFSLLLCACALSAPPLLPAAAAAIPTLLATPSPTAYPTATPTAPPIPGAAPPTATAALSVPQPILEIPLAGPAASTRAELSGMAWYGEYLVLLPQYPSRFGSGDGAFFVLDRAEIEAFVEGSLAGPLTPRLLPIDAPGLRARFPGYEGFESLVFDGKRVYLTVETRPTDAMLGWILAGRVEPDLSVLHIDLASALAITPQTKIGNLTDEAIVLAGSGDDATLLTIYEANGRLVNAQPVAHRFSADLTPLEPLPFPPVEYRITDATPADENGRFWAINYFYPGDVKLRPGRDSLLRLLVSNLPQVERLVEFQISDNAVRFAGTPPVYLELLEADARNWEGIARLGERGFLLVTDNHPRTILAYVAKP